MSGSLLEIRKKIGGVKNTRKITKAMQLVAASKMRQFQKRALSVRHYVWDLFAILEDNLDSKFKSSFTEKRTEGKTLFVLYTSDKGLCGPLNNKLNNALYRSDKWNSLQEDEKMLVTVGKKSYDYARHRNIPVTKHYSSIPERLSFVDMFPVVEGILKLWREDKIKEVIFVAPHYKNSFTFYPILKTFLPFSEATIESAMGPLEAHEKPERKVKEEGIKIIYEPSKEIILERLYEQLVQSLFTQSFLELKASEYSSRMIAMQNATDAADRIVSDLTRDYNKARQSVITRELAELMGASDAITS